MTLVKDIMRSNPITIHIGSSLTEAIRLMTENKIGFLIIVDGMGSKKLTGVVSDTDFVRKVLYEKIDTDAKRVDDIMATEVITVSPEGELVEAVETMIEKRLKRLPVVKDGNIEGVLSISDIINIFVEYKKKLLDLALGF